MTWLDIKVKKNTCIENDSLNWLQCLMQQALHKFIFFDNVLLKSLHIYFVMNIYFSHL